MAEIPWLTAGVASIAINAYVSWRALRRPEEDVVAVGQEPRRAGERRIVCAGDSLTHASVSFDYVHRLRQRLGPNTRIFNAGVNGDLAFNLAERLQSIVDCVPDVVVVLIGTNDICGAQTQTVAKQQQRSKRLPQLASLAFFEEHLTRFLSGLRAQSSAKIIVVTPPLLGEDVMHAVNDKLRTYAQRTIDIAHAHGADVIAFHAAMTEALRVSGHSARPGFKPGFVEMLWLLLVPFQRYLLGMSFDRIAHSHGLWGSADLIHLNETSGSILADLLENKLRALMNGEDA